MNHIFMMLNNNTQLLAKSKVLSDYMIFVNRVRENLEYQKKIAQNAPEYDEAAYEEDLEAAINEAIDYCIEHHIMETFFRENRSEVTKSMVLDYTWERREELIRAEEYEDGKREGLEIGRLEGEKRGRAEGEKDTHRFLINKWLQKGKTIAEIAEDLGKSEEYVESLM